MGSGIGAGKSNNFRSLANVLRAAVRGGVCVGAVVFFCISLIESGSPGFRLMSSTGESTVFGQMSSAGSPLRLWRMCLSGMPLLCMWLASPAPANVALLFVMWVVAR